MSDPNKPQRDRKGISHHLSAEDILPADVLRSVQDHFRGGRLYIPSPVSTLERDAEICEDWGARRVAGEYATYIDKDMAEHYGLSVRRIQQITTVARLRGKNKRKGKGNGLS